MPDNVHENPYAKKGPSAVPVFSDQDRERVKEALPEIISDIKRLKKSFTQLKKNFKNGFDRVSKQHPSLISLLDSLQLIAKEYTTRDHSLTDAELYALVDGYNLYARRLNSLLTKIKNEEDESRSKENENIIHALEMGSKESLKLTKAQEAEVKKYAKALWNEFFPKTNVTQFVEWSNRGMDSALGIESKGELTDTQKLLIAPANGIERVIVGFASLLDIDTYKNLVNSVETLSGMSYKDWCDSVQFMKMVYDQMSTTDSAAAAVSLIYGMGFLLSGMSRAGATLKRLKAPKYIRTMMVGASAMRTGAMASTAVNVLPAGVIGSVSLKYIKLPKAA